MLLLNEIIIFITIIFLTNYIVNKKKILTDNKYFTHKKFSSNYKTPLTGGFFFLVTVLYYYEANLAFKFCLILIFLIGISSDVNFITSPLKRIIFQIIIIGIFVIYTDSFVEETRLDLFDSLFENFFFKVIFTIFCYLILINGSNFIDGMNSLLLGYFLLVIVFLLLLSNANNLIIDYQLIEKIILCLFILFILNLLGILFVGDSGAYLISFLIGYILIKFTNDNPTVSPYYTALLLWYPAFENLFSIIRKRMIKFDAFNADNNHLHQIIFKSIEKKTKLNKFFCNNITSVFINLFNLLIFFLAFENFSYTKNLFWILLFCIFVYISLYIYLSKNFIKKKNN